MSGQNCFPLLKSLAENSSIQSIRRAIILKMLRTPKLMDNIFSGNNNINSIRFILAGAVLWSHSFALYYGTESFEPVAVATRGLYNAGNVGVASFLILSGALILRSWQATKSFRRFISKRACRIYPAYFVSVFLTAFIVAPIYSDAGFIYLIKTQFFTWFIRNLALQGYSPVDGVFSNSPITIMNGSLWSIYYEVICYLFLVIGAIALQQRMVAVSWLLLLLLIVARSCADYFGWNPGFGIIGQILGWPYLWFSVGGWFITGMLYYQYRGSIPRSFRVVCGLLICWVMITWLPTSLLFAKLLNNILFTPILGYILFYICSVQKLFIEKVARKNDLSYGMYLYAFPIQQVILAEFGHDLTFAMYVILSLISTMLISAASWWWIERRFINM